MADSPSIPIITIDGPSGSGKGTLALRLAKKLQWHFLDSGAIYRTLAFAATKHRINLQEINLEQELALVSLAREIQVTFHDDIILEGEIITDHIRTEFYGNLASKIAAHRQVRQALLECQRAFCKLPGLVADGRDMGTIVFPKASLKIFLEASAEERAKRRFFQLKEKGHNVTLQSLLAEIMERDARDKQRVVAPLIAAEDAVVIDTTNLGIEAVFERVMQEVKAVFIKVNF